MKRVKKDDVIEFVNDNGLNLFGRFTPEIAKAIAKDVVAECREQEDEVDMQEAIAYVIGEKFGMFD